MKNLENIICMEAGITQTKNMKIVSEKTQFHRFAFYYDYSPERVDFCRSLKDSFGWEKFTFKADDGKKRWIFSDSIFIPVIMEKFPDVYIEPDVLSVVGIEQSWLKKQNEKASEIEVVKNKTETDFNVKGLKKELYQYQKVGVEFLVKSGGRAINADSMGVGKSAQALAYIKHMGFERTLIVSPASVKFAWEKEIKKWTNLSYVIIDSKTNLAEIDHSTKIWIVNYDILRKHLNQLTKTRFECVVGDEAHFIKSIQAIRTKAFRMISKNIPHVILLSGTPLLSRPSELFSLLNIIDPSTWDNFYSYARKFCDAKQTRFGFDASGASNIEELHNRIKKYFIRREKSEVLKELPPKNFIEVPVELDKETATKYKVASENLATYLRKYEGKQPPAIAKMLAGEKLTKLNVLRQLNSVGKLAVVKEMIDSVLESGEKVLVFSSFVEPLETLQAIFGDKAVMITGKTPVEVRGAIVEKFQTDKNIKIFLGGYKSAGTGITLTAASNFIALDMPWNPSDLQQSIDRLHRPGQTANSVNVYQLFAKDTIDEDMKDILEHKQDIFDQVIDGKTSEDIGKKMMDKAIQRIMKK